MNLVMMVILIKASTTMTLQGEVVSEMLDVDEVEEAFAKMRRAAGVIYLHFSQLWIRRIYLIEQRRHHNKLV